MKTKLPLCEGVNNDTLLRIADERFPEFKSYEQKSILGKFVCIDRNALGGVLVKVNHNPSKNRTTLKVNRRLTILGSILLGALWAELMYRSFSKEVHEVYCEELQK